MKPALEVRDLNVWFEMDDGPVVHAVRDLTFSLEAGERFGLAGESGCGKTTTINALMGLLPANAVVAGSIIFDGQDILRVGEASIAPHRWVDLSIVFQGAMNSFNPVLTVGSQIEEAILAHRPSTEASRRERTTDLLELVGIPISRRNAYPHELSGGMRQRAALAMALACEPGILLADEPTTALDAMVQAQILELLVRLANDMALAVILVTHDLGAMARVCTRAAVMYAGEIIECGPLDDLFHQPRHPYTRLLFEATPDIEGRGPLAWIPGSPPRLDVALAGCPFRPRCPSAFGPCPTHHPELISVGDQHRAACHLNGFPGAAT